MSSSSSTRGSAPAAPFSNRRRLGSVAIQGFEGFLTGAKGVAVTQPTIPAATDIHIRVRPRGRFRKPSGGMFKCIFEASVDGIPIAKGTLSSFVQTVVS